MPDKEKEKNKLHPFAGQLYPDEEVLWMSPPIPTRAARQQSNVMAMGCFYIAIYGVFIAVIVSAFVWVQIGNDAPMTGAATLAALAALGIGAVFVGGFFKPQPYETVDHFYAVTNERLLYGRAQTMDSLALEKIHTITLLKRSQGRGILSFGGAYLLWPEMDEAARVKEIIETAKRQRASDRS